ncbi:MAG TPA: molybdopterin-dependent oxidoreductase [Planctomycetaceae bacterium]|nr:molybdopterin-dependent oxidoreductase [Planctomycetaceae bacterium]
MPTVFVNDKPVELAAGEKLNCIEAAARAGIEVPSYCYHPALSVVASCRMCLVEVGDKKPDGSTAMQPKLFPGCQTPVKDGSVVITNSQKVKDAQKATLEYLLLNHPLDCPVCDQAGECGLQDFSYRYGRGYSRLNEPKNLKPDKDYIGDQITLFTDRCIMCTRCVRFTREISGTAELQVINRGSHEEIDIFPGEPCNNKLAGNVVDLCPVGALCSKDFLYEQRVWWLKSKNSVCPGCSTGCSITVDQNNDTLYRLKPRFNPQAQGHFMCDEGRFGWKYVAAERRLSTPMQRRDGQVVSTLWEPIQPALLIELSAVVKAAPAKFAAVISPWSTVEEAYLLAKQLKALSPDVTLALGPVRTVGGDDQYPKSVTGAPPKEAKGVKFTIRAEKAPNRRGVELVLQHFQGEVISFEVIAQRLSQGQLEGLFVLNADPEATFPAEFVQAAAKLKLLIVQDLLQSPLSDAAHFVLAGAAWAEKDGTFVNHAGLAQPIFRGLRGPGDARPDGRILWELAGRGGLFRASTVRQEIANEIVAFSPLILGDLGDHGVMLTNTTAAPTEKMLQPV